MAGAAEPKIFKKVEVVEGGGHHGGGWKVAYADFMTAMMAFFLLMWILASSDEQKLRGIAEYFTDATMPGGSGVLDGATFGPPGTLTASNGAVVARGSELGKVDDPSPAQWEVRDVTQTSDPQEKVIGSQEGEHENPAGADVALELAQAGADGEGKSGAQGTAETDIQSEHPVDEMQFKQLQEEIMQAMQNNPDLDPLTENVIFEQTTEGLHIQIIDQEGKPMFRSGKAEMTGPTRELMANLGDALAQLPNRIVLSGHTDAVPFANSAAYDNWDLSTDRANATRRVFEAMGVNRERIIRVSGMADTQLLVPENPKDPSNRRISIKVQYRDKAPMAAPQPASTPETDIPQASPKLEMESKDQVNTDTASSAPKAKEMAPAKVTSTQSLDDQVFDNLRNALR